MSQKIDIYFHSVMGLRQALLKRVWRDCSKAAADLGCSPRHPIAGEKHVPSHIRQKINPVVACCGKPILFRKRFSHSLFSFTENSILQKQINKPKTKSPNKKKSMPKLKRTLGEYITSHLILEPEIPYRRTTNSGFHTYIFICRILNTSCKTVWIKKLNHYI